MTNIQIEMFSFFFFSLQLYSVSRSLRSSGTNTVKFCANFSPSYMEMNFPVLLRIETQQHQVAEAETLKFEVQDSEVK